MKTYQYDALQENEIRLVTLPSEASGAHAISVSTARLFQDEIPSYEALSHAWASKMSRKSIQVHSSDPEPKTLNPLVEPFGQRRSARRKPNTSHASTCSTSLQVARNLALALEHLRLPSEDRMLWIDAICINQRDLIEKGHQVGRMADIFKPATRIVVWLGPATPRLLIGLYSLSHISSMIEVDFRLYSMAPAPGQDPDWADNDVEMPYDDEARSAINQ